MINYKVGDLVASYKNNELGAYAQQCNCFCRMGRGIAPLLAKANPNVRLSDNDTKEGDKGKLGNYTYATKPEGGSVLYNIYGQFHWSLYKVAPNRNTDYTALQRGLIKVRKSMLDNSQTSIGFPLIGCGLAGGDWEVVSKIIEEVFEGLVDITVFVLEKDKKVVEDVIGEIVWMK